ncbi:DNA-binding response regulator [Acrocarpospora pleiomorpha]|uniref:DNA-binding response regulator n=1 Tax=Acrocarpospora pleiomorpha TaxID=90975 RepID=A0A5M3XPZ3_9ACTN|nr:response regulator transcription factor [Acrocarpospora pleiomorpha]GES21243.1 DNA-binding response regulator [Acrocarpospora pleiomorpha]
MRIVVIERDPLARGGITAILRHEEGIKSIVEVSAYHDLSREPSLSETSVCIMGVDRVTDETVTLVSQLRHHLTGSERPIPVIMLTPDWSPLDIMLIKADAYPIRRDHIGPMQLVWLIRVITMGYRPVYRALVQGLTDRFTPVTGEIRQILTKREYEVLTLIARGKVNGEIATELGVAISTVKTHVTKVLRKLGARNRAQAVMAAGLSD